MHTRTTRRLSAAAWLGLFVTVSLSAQPSRYGFSQLTSDQGLSQNSVYAILQDTAGFMWFGTKDGLNRYDGLTFALFTHDPADSTSLSDNFVTVLYQDRRGRMWVGSQRGTLDCYDPRTETFQRIALGTSGDYRGSVNAITEDAFGNVWVAADGLGILRLSSRDGSRIAPATGTGFAVDRWNTVNTSAFRGDRFGAVYVDHRGTLWVADVYGLLSLDLTDPSARFEVRRAEGTQPNGPITILCFTEDRTGRVWAGTDRGLYSLDIKNRTLVPQPGLPLADPGVRAVCEDDEGSLWLATFDTIALFDPDRRVYSPAPDGLRMRSAAISIRKDRSGALWIGTNGDGISFGSPNIVHFESFTAKNAQEHGWPGGSVRSLLEDSQRRVWVGSYSGLFVSDSDRRNFRKITVGAGTPVKGLLEDRNRNIWIAGDDGIVRMGPDLRSVRSLRRHSEAPDLHTPPLVTGIFADRDGVIWSTTPGSISRWNERAGTWTHFRFSPPVETNDPTPTTVRETPDGNLWLTSPDGLWRFDPRSETFRRYTNDPNDAHSLSTNITLSLCLDPSRPERYLWVGTSGGGLDRFDLTDGRCTVFTQAEGLPNNVVYGILPDRRGALWLSTNRGLARFDPATGSVMRYDRGDGLQSSEYNSGPYVRSADGELFFGGINGFDIFLPEAHSDNRFDPPVAMTGLFLFNERVELGDSTGLLSSSITLTRQITLDHRQNNIAFTFAALDFTSPQKNQCEYQLTGFDPSPVHVHAGQSATYTNVDPGTYTFVVRGTNSSGVWSSHRAELTVVVLPPFWMTWWFRLVVGLTVLGGVIGGVRFFSVRKLQEHVRMLEAQRAVESERSRISRDMHDHLGAPLSKMILLGELAERSLRSGAERTEAAGYLGTIAGTAREVVNTMDELVWALNPRNDTLDRLMMYLSQYAEQYLESTDLRCRLDVPPSLPPDPIPSQTRHNVYMVIKEALTNSVKYADAREIWLRYRDNNDRYTIILQDDGKGFTQSGVDQFSNGILNMRKRVEDIGGVLKIETAPGAGTSVQVTLPLLRSAE